MIRRLPRSSARRKFPHRDLDRGATVKRDPVAAQYWAKRAVKNPAKDETTGNPLVLLGRLLAEHPQARVNHPKRVLFYALEAAELDEPGAETLGKRPVSGPARSL